MIDEVVLTKRNIIEDEREIVRIVGDFGVIGTSGRHFEPDAYVDSRVCEIRPYYENGEMAPVVWFEILKNLNNKLIVVKRINGKYVQEVEYCSPEKGSLDGKPGKEAG